MVEQPHTPPNEPISNLYLTAAELRQIVEGVIPSAKIVSASHLPRGSSFNNRIYTISLQNVRRSPSCSEVILKVGGRFWKRTKTLNEVTCLNLVARYCPEIPVPRVLGWCNDASEAQCGGHEWILMTKLPGVPLVDVEHRLDISQLEILVHDIALTLEVLRTKVPSTYKLGNLLGINADGKPILGGLVDMPAASGGPWQTYLAYFQAVMKEQMRKLEIEDIYCPNRHLASRLKHFIHEDATKLPIFQDSISSTAVMTHLDVSTRNILVTETPQTTGGSRYQISGLVDWEFSGFYSPFDENLAIADNMELVCAQAVTDSLGSMLIANLAKLEAASARGKAVEQHLAVAKLLHQIKENTAPWWLRDRQEDEVVTSELQTAARLVVEALDRLGSL